MSSRRLGDLDPRMENLARVFLTQCRAAGIDILVTCTYRSPAEQADLYAQGRTAPGKIVTNAKPGESKHNAKLPDGSAGSQAFDVVPLRFGKPVWDETDPLWDQIGAIGIGLGLEWAGHWEHFKEYPHFQLPGDA